MRRFSGVALVALAIATTVVGCAEPAGGGGTTTDCTDTVRTAGEPGEAEPLLVLGSPGFAPTIVYADGAVVVPTATLDDAAAAAAGAAGPRSSRVRHG